MSRQSDTSTGSLPSADTVFAMDSSSEQIANLTVRNPESLSVQVLSAADSHIDDTSYPRDIDMTMIKKMISKTTGNEKTNKKAVNKKIAFNRKFSSIKDANGRTTATRVSSLY
jgi:hypothetical protein